MAILGNDQRLALTDRKQFVPRDGERGGKERGGAQRGLQFIIYRSSLPASSKQFIALLD